MWARFEADSRPFRQIMEPDVADVVPPKRIGLAVVAQYCADAAICVEGGDRANHNPYPTPRLAPRGDQIQSRRALTGGANQELAARGALVATPIQCHHVQRMGAFL